RTVLVSFGPAWAYESSLLGASGNGTVIGAGKEREAMALGSRRGGSGHGRRGRRQAFGEMAGHRMSRCHRAQDRPLALAHGFGIRTARVKAATRRRCSRARRIALQKMTVAAQAGYGHRNRGNERPRVGMARVLEEHIALGKLDD